MAVCIFLVDKENANSERDVEPAIPGEQLLHLGHDLLGMSLAQLVGPLDVARFDRGDHLGMFIDEALGKLLVIRAVIQARTTCV